MAVISTLSVKMDLDSSGFTRSLDDVKKKLDETGAKLRGLGTQLTGAVTAPIVGAFGAAVWAASDLNETLNKTNVVFGDASGSVVAWSEDSATAFGLSQNEALGYASTLGNIFTSMGMAGDEASKLSTDIVALGADLGSFNNVPTAEALEAIRAGLLGEYEPLRRFGIVLNEAAVEAKAMEMGLVDANGEISEQNKVLARQALIAEGSVNAQGDFAETSGSLANQMKILRARLTDAAAAIGQVLLPYVTRLVGFLGGLIERFQGLDDRAKKIVVVIGLIAAAIGPLLFGIGVLLPVITNIITVGGKVIQLFKAIRLAMMSSLGPILLIVAVLAVLYLIWSKDLFGIKTKITAWFNAFKESKTFERLKEVFQQVKKAVLDFVGRALTKAVELFRRLVDAVKGPALSAFNAFKSVLATVVGAVGTVIGGIISRLDPLKSAFDGIKQMIVGLVGIFTNLFQGDLRGALDSAIDMFQGWLQYLSGLGGFILSLLSGALSAIWDAIAGVDWVGLGVSLLGYIEEALGQLVDLAGKMAVKAEEMVGGFVDWFTTYNWAGLGTTILGYIDDVAAAITGLATKLGTKASEWWSGFVDWFTTYDWEGLGKTIIGYVELAASYIFLPLVLYKHGETLINGLLAGIDAAWVFVKTWAGTVGSLVVGAVGNLVETLVQKGKDLITGIYNGIVNFWDNTLKPWLAAIGDAIWTALQYIVFPLLLYYYGEDIIDGMLAGITAAWFFVKNFFGTVKTTVVGYFSKALEWLLEKGKDVINGFKNGIDAIWSGAKGVAKWFEGIATKVTDAVPDLTTTLWQIGWDLIDGFWGGITSMWSWMTGELTKLYNQLPASIRKFLEVFSPSRVFYRIGEQVTLGLAKGILDSGDLAVAAVNAVGEQVAGVNIAAPTVAAAGQVMGGGIASGAITINVSGAGDPTMVASEVYSRFARELGLRGAV